MVNGKKSLRFMVVVLAVVFCSTVYSYGNGVIKNPEPNMKEKEYVLLKRVKTIGADLGNDEFMFKPFSMTIDRDNNLYVYDLLQAKIIKFDKNLNFVKAFGRTGQGPGEFLGSHRAFPVFIKMGRDDKLYAHDLNAFKIMAFDRDGRYIDEYRRSVTNIEFSPTVDAAGNVYLLSVEGGQAKMYNQNKQKLFDFPIGPEVLHFLFYKPMAFQSSNIERLTAVTGDSRVLIYFRTSSTMYIVKDNKVEREMKIWPTGALEDYKPQLRELFKQNKFGYFSLFSRLILDEDDPNVFYLCTASKKKRINALYQLNMQGQLGRIFYLNSEESSNSTHFKFKKNNLFYAIEGENITIYEEAK